MLIESTKQPEENMNNICEERSRSGSETLLCKNKQKNSQTESFDQIKEFLIQFSGYSFLLAIFAWFRLVYFTIGRDLSGLFRLLLTKYYLNQFLRENASVPKLFAKEVAKHPKRIAIYYEDQEWSFERLHEYSNRVANVFIELGFKSGDEVALLMPNKPEYIGMWLGAAKAGLVIALINTNQRTESLAHSLNVICTKALIYDQELEQPVIDAAPLFKNKELQYFHVGPLNSHGITSSQDLNALMKTASSDVPKRMLEGNFTDKLFYIYTSGTTGMPKAAIIRHCRYMYFSTGVRNLYGLFKPEILYTCIPLYHLAGGGIGTSLCVLWGNSIVIKRKFSATSFWRDCARYKCTMAQYIGELCRYLLAQPPSAHDTQHQLRLMFGNGMRSDMWGEFVSRFGVEIIGEFYGSTEGNANVVNANGHEGACGFISQILPGPLTDLFYPVSLVNVDPHTGVPLRDSRGRCIRTKPGQCGEFIGRIAPRDATRAFDGYAGNGGRDNQASDRKILRNVYREGDAYFSSGDLLYLDDLGYVYFKERTGDTFRWKGENVSTQEVESLAYSVIPCDDCTVYGVPVPDCEGKAGMLAIGGLNGELDLRALINKMQRSLPVYAWPMFVRVTSRIEATSTLKISKVKLMKDGFRKDDRGEDQLFYYNKRTNEYLPITDNVYEKIMNKEIQF